MSSAPLPTLAEAGRKIAAGELSPVALTEAALARAEALQPKLDAFIEITAERARAAARWAEKEIAGGRRRGPLHGIPYGLKDIYDAAGLRTTAHSRLLLDNVASADAETTARLEAAGMILIGKLATHEFATGGPAFDLPFPPAHNPWNTAHFTGGSSSGSGAAVAAGILPLAMGSDTGGSIRLPAAYCGTVGLKPTYGRVSRRGVFPNTFTMDHIGPMTRSAEDISLMLQVIAGYDPADPGSEDCPVPDYAASLGQGVRGMRLGLVEGWHDALGAHPDLGPAIAKAVSVLRSLGATVELVKLSSLRDYTDCKTTISIAELYTIHEQDLRTRPQDFGRILRNRVLPGALIRAEDYQAALRWRTALTREQHAAFRQFDALITAGARGIADPAKPDNPDRLVTAPSITMPFSVSGVPALAIPCGFSREEGMPLSLQIAAAPFQETTVLRVAHAYQQATDWHRRHPKLGE